jgi:hypothetical protein
MVEGVLISPTIYSPHERVRSRTPFILRTCASDLVLGAPHAAAFCAVDMHEGERGTHQPDIVTTRHHFIRTVLVPLACTRSLWPRVGPILVGIEVSCEAVQDLS